MTQQAVILAGGLGTRLRDVVSDRPKVMASVHGRPFLSYQFDYLIQQGIKQVVVSTGYLGEMIVAHFGNSYKGLSISYAQEKTAQGTGGGLLLASGGLKGKAFMLNGDSLFRIPLADLDRAYQMHRPSAVLALRKVDEAGRYGRVETDSTNRIIAFREKDTAGGEGLINGGIYLMEVEWLQRMAPSESFSIEKEIFTLLAPRGNFIGLPFDDYFIDIGIPEDYKRACNEFTP